MTTSRIAHESKALIELTGHADAQAGDVANRITELAKRYNFTLTFDAKAVILGLSALASLAASDMGGKDATHGGIKGGHKGPAAHRDQLAEDLRINLRAARTSLTTQFGATQVAEVFAPGPIPDDVHLLLGYTNNVVKNLSPHAAHWKPEDRAFVPVDIAATVALFQKLGHDLGAEVDNLAKNQGLNVTTRIDRDTAADTLHDMNKGLGHILVGFQEFVGNHEAADHTRTKHHVGHHAPRGQTNPPAPTGTASTTAQTPGGTPPSVDPSQPKPNP